MLRTRLILSWYGCFDKYNVTFYGTTYFVKEEAIVLHIVMKYWEIIELIIWLHCTGCSVRSEEHPV